MTKYKKALKEFANSLKKGDFYEAHDVLEAIWFPIRFQESGETKLLKGLINASVSFELYKQGKVEPSERVWKTYLKYRDLIEKIDSPYRDEYLLIVNEIDTIKKDFIN